jgi:hypothetical protein
MTFLFCKASVLDCRGFGLGRFEDSRSENLRRLFFYPQISRIYTDAYQQKLNYDIESINGLISTVFF